MTVRIREGHEPKPSSSSGNCRNMSSKPCNLEYRDSNVDGLRTFFCTVHQQWHYENPVTEIRTFKYANDSSVVYQYTTEAGKWKWRLLS